MQKEIERREHPRREFDGPVRVRESGSCSTRLSLCLGCNVSEGGMELLSEDDFPVGAFLFLEFSLPGHPLPMSVMSRVCRSRPSDFGRRHGSGLQFTKFLQGDREAFSAFLAS